MRQVTRRAMYTTEHQGLWLPIAPEGEVPELPADITQIPDEELMRLLVVFNGWADYAAGVVAGFDSDEEDLERELNREKSAASLRNSALRTVTAQKAAALSDPAVEKLGDEYQLVRGSRKFAAVVRDSAEHKGAIVSRELTRRVGRHDREARGNRWNP